MSLFDKIRSTVLRRLPQHAYAGHVMARDAFTVWGWAVDRADPNRRLDIDIYVGDSFRETVRAETYSQDLQVFGDGCHSFTFNYPSFIESDEKLTAKIKDADFSLVGGPLPRRKEVIEFIAADIVNQCNLRCPFCFVDYDNMGSLKLMTRETYDRYMTLLPIVVPGGFWLSCAHEPMLHPQFVDFIYATPLSHRDRLSFTTNLARRVSDDFLVRLANSGIHEIRVSLDSRRAEVFESLRRKAKFSVFDDNLRRLAAALKTSKNRPRLRLMTMALEDNKTELVDLVRFGKEIGADSHEVRYAYYVPQLARWGKAHFLSLDQWSEVERDLASFQRPALDLAGPPRDVLAQCEAEEGLDDYVPAEHLFGGEGDLSRMPAREPHLVGRQFPNEPLQLRLRWDGAVVSTRVPESVFLCNINTLDDPREYFRALRFTAAATPTERVSSTEAAIA